MDRITEEDALRFELIASRRAALVAQARVLELEEAALHAQIRERYGVADGDAIDVASRKITRAQKAREQG